MLLVCHSERSEESLLDLPAILQVCHSEPPIRGEESLLELLETLPLLSF